MKSKELFTTRSVVAQLLFAASLFTVGAAEAQQQPTFPGFYPKSSTCEASRDKISKAVEQFNDACGFNEDCIKSALDCGPNGSIGKQILESDGTDEDHCSTVAQACPELLPGGKEATAERRLTRQERKELEKERLDLQKQQQEQMKQQMEEANKMQEDADKAAEDYRKTKKEASEKLQETLSKINTEKANAVKQAQKEYDEIDKQYIQLRNELRRIASKISNTEFRMGVECRAGADSVARESEKQLDERLKAEAATIQNIQFARAAYRRKQLLQKKRAKIINMYNQFLSKCQRGEVDPGRGIKIELDQLKSQNHDDTATANDQAARLEKLRLQINQQMAELEKQLNEQQQQAVKSNQEEIQEAELMYQQKQQRLQQRQMQSAMQSMQANQLQAKQAENLNSRMDDAKGEDALASARAKCSKLPDEVSKQRVANNKSVSGAIMNVQSACSNISCGSSQQDKEIEGFIRGQCNAFYSAHQPKFKKAGKSVPGYSAAGGGRGGNGRSGGGSINGAAGIK